MLNNAKSVLKPTLKKYKELFKKQAMNFFTSFPGLPVTDCTCGLMDCAVSNHWPLEDARKG